MNSKAIVTQGHIPEFDPQGGLTAERKCDLFNWSLRNLRHNNPDAFIVLSGHGVLVPDFCDVDAVYWEDSCRPITPAGYVQGMPAQYVFVSKGLDFVQSEGIEHCLKTRTDCIIQRQNIAEWCQDILESENKQILLTQQTGENRVGDCFMYGRTEDLVGIWSQHNPIMSADGLFNTATHFSKVFKRPEGHSWLEYIRHYSSFRDVTEIPFVCIRWNSSSITKEQILNNGLDVGQYHWGRANDWHVFDLEGNMIKVYNKEFWSRKQFYSHV